MRNGTRFKGFFISIVVLALSAGVVFAGQALPSAAQPGLGRASEAAGFDVPVARGNPSGEDEVADEAPDGSTDGGAAAADDESDTAPEVEAEKAWDNHGAMVSEAAHLATPEGFRNHGHFVSCVAHMDFRVEPGAEPLDLAALTPEDCDEDADDEDAEETEEAPVEEEPTDEVEAAWDNHGDLVSTAAQMDTPDGFRNHGHFVSCVAHAKDFAAVPADLSTLTPEDCDEAEAEAAGERTAEGATADKAKGKDKAKDKSRNKEQHHNKGKGKGRR